MSHNPRLPYPHTAPVESVPDYGHPTWEDDGINLPHPSLEQLDHDCTLGGRTLDGGWDD
jgi:hypothetical protein